MGVRKNVLNVLGDYIYLLFEASFLLVLILYGINKILENAFDFGVLIVLYATFGFVLVIFNTNHSYYGSLIMSSSFISLVLLSTYGIVFKKDYIVFNENILIFTISYVMISIGHFISHDKDWPILNKIHTNKSTYSGISYILTLSLMAIFYLDSSNLPNKMTYIIFILTLVYLYGISTVNYCHREHIIQSYIDISNRNYSNRLLSYLKKRNIVSENQNEIIVSEFIKAITQFIEGDYQNSVLSSYNAIEAFERITQWPNNFTLRNSKFGSRRTLIADWRNYIAHSNVEEDFVRQDKYSISNYLRAFQSIIHTYDILRLNQVSTFALDISRSPLSPFLNFFHH